MPGLSRQQEMILMSGEKRAMMPQQYYEQLCHFIIESLEAQKSVPFFGLLDQAEQNFAKEIKGNLSWYLLHVKQDLQARKIISVERGGMERR